MWGALWWTLPIIVVLLLIASWRAGVGLLAVLVAFFTIPPALAGLWGLVAEAPLAPSPLTTLILTALGGASIWVIAQIED